MLFFVGCTPTGSSSTNTTSDAFQTLAAKVEFLERYVTFRRSYESLDFHIRFEVSGVVSVPGPSDYDVRLCAQVPVEQLDLWIPSGIKPSSNVPDLEWLTSVPGNHDVSGISEWFVDHRKIIGLDRKRNIVVYHAWSN